jgi:hypothetical protein
VTSLNEEMILSPPVLIILLHNQLMVVAIFIVCDAFCLLCLCRNLEFSNHSSICLICEVNSSGVVAESLGHHIVAFRGDGRVIIVNVYASEVASE